MRGPVCPALVASAAGFGALVGMAAGAGDGQIGTTSEGPRQRRAFLRALPSSPLASRVRGLCASADADPGF